MAQFVTIKIAGDSGDGIQLAGTELSHTSVLSGNDIATLPDFPAEIRAPIGTLAGVSGFQIQIGHQTVYTPGEEYDALVALNPAALKANLNTVKPNGIVIINTDNFNERGFKLAGYPSIKQSESSTKKITEDHLKPYRSYPIEITSLTKKALASEATLKSMTSRAKEKCKNFFALGLLFWLYERDLNQGIDLLKEKFSHNPTILLANLTALKAGHAYALANELFQTSYPIEPANFPSGCYRNVSGNEGIALGLALSSIHSGFTPVYCSYPITPASDILHHMSKLKKSGVITVQAEDEIAAAGMALGASYAGQIGITGSSGPGITLKMETINLAVMTELPLVVLNIQRAGPSTGMPTKTEQADLLQALYGRHGESPIPVIAPSRPSNCFHFAQEALRIATQFMTPVIVLSDGYIANGSEPWKIPEDPYHPLAKPYEKKIDHFEPYQREPQTLSRKWIRPGRKGLEHRIGGIEKENLTGHVSYDPENHHLMSSLRRDKIECISQFIPLLKVDQTEESDFLILGWGSTYGVIKSVVELYRNQGISIHHAHLHYLNPFPRNLEEILKKYSTIFVPEINFGQLSSLIRSKFLIETVNYNRLTGQPLQMKELQEQINRLLTQNAPKTNFK